MRWGLLLACLTVPYLAVAAMPQTDTTAQQAVLIDAATGMVLFAKKADEKMPTSSMSKMLTIYMVFDALKQGKLHLTDMIPVSEHAWKAEGSRMFLDVGSQVKVEDAIRGLVIQSGNDASVALAEAVGGTEDSFANRMNEMAAKLGLHDSHFVNATGLPNPQHYSTPHDLAKLGLALIRDFPEYYHYFSETEFTFHNIKQGNRNPLLYRKMGVDGIKTGHAEEAGFGLTASALRDGRRLVLVVNGLENMQARADEPARLLEWGFHEFNSYHLVKSGQQMAVAKTWLGTTPQVPLMATQDVAVTLPLASRAGLQVAVSYQEPLAAPIKKGQEVGKLKITAPDMPPLEIPLQAGADVAQQDFFDAVVTKLHFFLSGHS
jgi:D-alanyl-D-alanine carboxypeptidase (penicillin-binding protein 5/6)